MGVEGFTKLVPRCLIVCRASGGVVGPPHTCVSPQLLCGEEGLLVSRAAQSPELGLHHLKPVIGLQWLSCLSEERWMSSCKVPICGWSLSGVFLALLPPQAGVELATSCHRNLVCSSLDSRMKAMAWAKVGDGGGVPFDIVGSGSPLPLRVYIILSFK
jgi:hypothetical protein